MKKNKIVALTVALLGLWGCGQEGLNGTGVAQGEGRVQLTLEPGATIVVLTKASSTVDVAAFGVKISNSKGEEKKNYSSYSEVPAELALEAGDYVMTAGNNGLQKGAAFDRPYYAGTAPFSIKVGEITPVKVVCDLKSTGVELSYSETILNQVTDMSVSVSVTDGNLFYNKNEKRTGWFPIPQDGKMMITLRGKRNGTDFSSSQTISNVTAKQLRRITLDIKTSGSSETFITIDKEIIIKDVTIAVPDSDDVIDNNGDEGSWEEGGDPTPEPSGAPTIIGKSFNGQAFDIDQAVTIDKSIKILDVQMSSKAAGGIQSLMLEIESELLKDALEGLFGITGPIDLANPPQGANAPAWVASFTLMGILDPNIPIKGKAEHLFSVGELMLLLTDLDQVGGTPNLFKLTVVDANGTTAKTLTVIVAAP